MSFFGSTPSTSQSLFGSTMGTNIGNTMGTSLFNRTSTTFGTTSSTHNPNKDVELTSPPEDSISGLAFSPPSLQQNFLVSGSWDNAIRCWEVTGNANSLQTIPKAQQMHQGAVLDVRFSDVSILYLKNDMLMAFFICLQDGTKIFSASCDKTVKMWDLNSNQTMQVAQHDAPVKSVHFIKAINYTCLMTTSWDKTIKVLLCL